MTPKPEARVEPEPVDKKPPLLTFSEIKHLINGFGRIIVYEYIGLNGKGPLMPKEELKTRIQN